MDLARLYLQLLFVVLLGDGDIDLHHAYLFIEVFQQLDQRLLVSDVEVHYRFDLPHPRRTY